MHGQIKLRKGDQDARFIITLKHSDGSEEGEKRNLYFSFREHTNKNGKFSSYVNYFTFAKMFAGMGKEITRAAKSQILACYI